MDCIFFCLSSLETRIYCISLAARSFQTSEEKPTLVAVSIISVLFGWDVQFAWLRVVHGGVYLSRSIGALDQDPMMLQILIATDPGLHLFADGDW